MWKTALAVACLVLTAIVFALICPGTQAETRLEQAALKAEIIDVFAPPPSTAGSTVKLWAVINNTGTAPWPEGTAVNFRLEMEGTVLAERAADVSGEPVGSRRLESVRIKLPKKAAAGRYSLHAEIISGETTIAQFKRSTYMHVDPLAFFDGFENEDPTAGGWEFSRGTGKNKVLTTRETYYTGNRCLKLQLKGGGTAYLQYGFADTQPEQLSVSMRVKFDAAAMASGGPLNFFHIFDQSENIAAYAYYYTGEQRVQLAYLNEARNWEHLQLASYQLYENIWYNITASIKIGAKGHFRISVNGEQIINAEDNFDYGSISFLTIGHFPSDNRISGSVFIDDVRWAQEDVDTMQRGRVSLTFDDGTISQWENAKRYLDEYGYKASFYIVTDSSILPVDSQTGITYAMDQQQILELQNQGHIIGSHTDKHVRLGEVTTQEARTELQISKQRLRTWGIDVSSISFPWGSYNTDVLNIARRQYDFCLNAEEGLNVYDSVTGRIHLMRIDAVEKDFDTLKYWIDQAKETGTWLVVYYHSVGPGHTGDEYWETNRRFRKTLKYIDKQKLDVIPIELAPPR